MMDKRFGVTSEMPKGWVDIIDTDNNQTLCNIRVEYANNMIKLLNELHEEIEHLKAVIKDVEYQRDYVHPKYDKCRKCVKELFEENEQLQKSLSASVEKNRKLQTILDKLGYIYVGDLK